MAKTLTAKGLEHIKPGAARREIPDGLLSGLYLVVQPSGAMSWALRYRAAGIPRKLTLGRYPGIDLSKARELAKTALRAVAEGEDPSVEKKADRMVAVAGSDTVAAIAEEFITRHAKAKNRETTWKETERILNADVTPDRFWGKRRIGDIKKADVIRLLDRVTDRGATTMANRVLAAVRKMFNWALTRGLITVSPCEGVEAPADERERERVLADWELALIWKAADGQGWPFGRVVQLLALTGQRRDEVGGMNRAEVDLEARLWTMTRERSKNDVAHTVPLSDTAVKLLAELPKVKNAKGLLFTITGKTPVSGFSRAKEQLDKAIAEIQAKEAKRGEKPKRIEPWVFHDLRRTVATNLARMGQPIHVVEAVLNHKSGTIKGVAKVYNRYSYDEEKRAALEAWARHLDGVICGKTSNVVAIASARHS